MSLIPFCIPIKQWLKTMANEQHFAKLKSGVSVWNDWRKRYPKLRPDLIGASLGVVDLRGAKLHDVDLRDADLHAAIFTDSGIYEATGQTRKQSHRANFRGANLSMVDLHGADLCEADLTGANLTRANFRGSDLRGATLEEADLASADLMAADLRRAYLHRANLHRTDLSGVSLIGADLSSAVLVRTNLNGANLSGADLSNAKLFEAILANVDLSDVHGLELCSHSGPSVVDHRTLELSGTLNSEFLRGAGLTEPLIEGLPSLLRERKEFYSCFISYSHGDKGFARRLHDELQERGIRCWMDEGHILPGEDIYEAIDIGVQRREKFLLCCSENSLNSPWVDRELDKALQKEEALWRKRGQKVHIVIPLDLDGELIRWRSAKASVLRSRKAANFIGWANSSSQFDKQLENLIAALRREEDARPGPSL